MTLRSRIPKDAVAVALDADGVAGALMSMSRLRNGSQNIRNEAGNAG